MGKEKAKKIPKYAGVYNELADLLGEEAVEIIYNAMSGQQVTFPRKMYTPEYVIQMTKDITDRTELKKVAIRYGYSERRLKQLLKRESECGYE